MFRKRARRQGERRLPIQEAPSPWPLAAKCGTLLELMQLAAPELCAVGAERKKAPPLDRGREAGPWGTWLDCVSLAKAILTSTVSCIPSHQPIHNEKSPACGRDFEAGDDLPAS
jgi:hypothetical protein